jgi:hypothetical protein
MWFGKFNRGMGHDAASDVPSSNPPTTDVMQINVIGQQSHMQNRGHPIVHRPASTPFSHNIVSVNRCSRFGTTMHGKVHCRRHIDRILVFVVVIICNLAAINIITIDKIVIDAMAKICVQFDCSSHLHVYRCWRRHIHVVEFKPPLQRCSHYSRLAVHGMQMHDIPQVQHPIIIKASGGGGKREPRRWCASSVVIALRGYDIGPPSQSRAKDDSEIIHPTIAAHSYSCSYFSPVPAPQPPTTIASSFSPFDDGSPLLPSSQSSPPFAMTSAESTSTTYIIANVIHTFEWKSNTNYVILEDPSHIASSCDAPPPTHTSSPPPPPPTPPLTRVGGSATSIIAQKNEQNNDRRQWGWYGQWVERLRKGRQLQVMGGGQVESVKFSQGGRWALTVVWC